MAPHADDPAFLGRGWSFPPSFSSSTGQVDMVSGDEDIRQSLRILLSTAVGERVMVPGFGCNLSALLFEQVRVSYLTKLEDVVRSAILDWEPRITVHRIQGTIDPREAGLLHLSIEYTVRRTNTRSNFVFPFYVNEATIAPPAL